MRIYFVEFSLFECVRCCECDRFRAVPFTPIIFIADHDAHSGSIIMRIDWTCFYVSDVLFLVFCNNCEEHRAFIAFFLFNETFYRFNSMLLETAFKIFFDFAVVQPCNILFSCVLLCQFTQVDMLVFFHTFFEVSCKFFLRCVFVCERFFKSFITAYHAVYLFHFRLSFMELEHALHTKQ